MAGLHCSLTLETANSKISSSSSSSSSSAQSGQRKVHELFVCAAPVTDAPLERAGNLVDALDSLVPGAFCFDHELSGQYLREWCEREGFRHLAGRGALGWVGSGGWGVGSAWAAARGQHSNLKSHPASRVSHHTLQVMYKAQMTAQWTLFLEAAGGEAAAAAAAGGATVEEGEVELADKGSEDAVAALLERADRMALGVLR